MLAVFVANHAPVVPRRSGLGVEFDGSVQVGDRVIKPAEHVVMNAPAAPHHRVLGVQLDGLGVVLEGILNPTLLLVSQPPVVIGGGMVGSPRDAARERHRRAHEVLFPLAEVAQARARPINDQ